MPEEARLQDTRNRQNSILADDAGLTDMMQNTMLSAFTVSDMAYNELLNKGVAKEVARLVLPQSAFTRLYVTGSVRSWMHYLGVRDEVGVVQWEHVELARAIRQIFAEQFPTVNRAFFDRDSDPRDRQIIELEAELSTLQAKLRRQ
jgi:thymidylate synthase (FAD)